MNSREKRTKMMGEENIKSVLIKLAFPAIIGMLVNAIYNIVDTIFVGKLGTSAIGAVSVVFPLFMLVGAVGLTFGVGAASYISRLLGEGRKSEADKTTSIAFFSSMIVGIVFTIIGLIYLEPILKLFGATDTIMPFAKDYARVLVSGSVFTMINMTMNNMLRAEGSAKISMIALSTGALLNIILDPIFIFTFDMGIVGASAATVLAQIISTILLLSYFITGKSYIKISPKYFSFSKKIYSEIFKIGTPTFIRQALSSIAIALLNVATSPYGDAAVASMGITLRVISMAMYVVFGYGQGFQPVAGYNYGAKKFDRLNESIKVSLKWTTIFCIIISIIFMVFTKPIISLFSNDQDVIDIASKTLRAMSILLPLFGFQNVYATLFQALGKGTQATILSISRQGIFLIPALLILPKAFKLNGVIFSQPIADFFNIIVTAVLAIEINKKLKKQAINYRDLDNKQNKAS